MPEQPPKSICSWNAIVVLNFISVGILPFGPLFSGILQTFWNFLESTINSNYQLLWGMENWLQKGMKNISRLNFNNFSLNSRFSRILYQEPLILFLTFKHIFNDWTVFMELSFFTIKCIMILWILWLVLCLKNEK